MKRAWNEVGVRFYGPRRTAHLTLNPMVIPGDADHAEIDLVQGQGILVRFGKTGHVINRTLEYARICMPMAFSPRLAVERGNTCVRPQYLSERSLLVPIALK